MKGKVENLKWKGGKYGISRGPFFFLSLSLSFFFFFFFCFLLFETKDFFFFLNFF